MYVISYRLLSSQSDAVYHSLWEDYITVSQVVYDYREPDDPFSYVKYVKLSRSISFRGKFSIVQVFLIKFEMSPLE